MIYQQVRKIDPVFLWHKLDEITLDLLGRLVRSETEPLGEARYVSVDNNAARDAERIAKHDIRGLASHSRQRQQFFHRFGDAVCILLAEDLARALNRFRFVAEKAGSANIVLKLAG